MLVTNAEGDRTRMFQSFDNVAMPKLVAPRVKVLREIMSTAKLDAYLVPRADEYQGEYVPESAERLRFITGFSGSAGIAVVAAKAAALLVDSRYTVQVKSETDTSIFETPELPRARISEWLVDKLPKAAVVGFDPMLFTYGEAARLREALAAKGLVLKSVAPNLVDQVWGRDRPATPAAPIVPHPLKLAGRSSADKIEDVRKRLVAEGQGAALVTLSDSVCWLFNVRGGDVAHNPVVLAFALVLVEGKAELYVDEAKLTPEARTHLDPVAKLLPPKLLPKRLREFNAAGGKVRFDPETAAFAFGKLLGGPSRFSRGADPCIAMKSRKSIAEIKGTRAAHLRDGAAMVRCLAWLDREAPKGKLDEITVVRALEGFRRETNQLLELSFDTICGSGPNGAIVHYRVNEATNRKLGKGELLLLDSGGQYRDGTTDITRTIAIGRPSPEMCERFTLVLKGHIAIATARFPKGTRGIDLDPFARRPLWERGLDYGHGTGHGVGSYLNVHEGPQSISRAGAAVLEPGMIISNEPGYYKTSAYGIRIENLILVTEPAKVPGGDREIMSFETLTLCPIDRRLVVASLLSPAERQWLDGYHARVWNEIGPEVDGDVRAWLSAACKPI